MGIAVAPSIDGGPLRRLLTAQLIADESWALAVQAPVRLRLGTLVGAGPRDPPLLAVVVVAALASALARAL